jgi:signal transduction histidine kinase/CheY-like chemotaxis protein
LLEIAVLGRLETSLLAALGKAGRVSAIENPALLPIGGCDLLVVDQRAALRDSMPGLATLDKLQCPVVALVDQDCTGAGFSNGYRFDDWIPVCEVEALFFAERLQRLVSRHLSPINIDVLNQPEVTLLQAVANHANDWLILKDLDHRFLLVSESFANVVGLPREQIIGRNDLEIGSSEEAVFGNSETGWIGFWPQDDAVVAAGEAAFEENPQWNVFSKTKRHRRTERIPLKNSKGEVYALLVCSSDVTDIMRTTRDLRERNVMLQKVMEEKRKAEDSRRLAEQAIMAKNKFLAAASHDLRQPLHAQGLFLEVLSRRIRGKQERDILDKIKNSTEALTTLFNSLLDISRLDAGVVEAELRHFNMLSLMQNLQESFVEVGARKSLHVAIEPCRSVVYTDPVLFGRVLRNLIQNAVTHTVEGSVTVKTAADNGSLMISIADTGPGIPAEEHAAIFSEFYQLSGVQGGATRGLGLGLSIVQRLAGMLNLSLKLESTVGQGTLFTVQVPLGDVQEIAIESAHSQVLGLNGCTVLVIDDEAAIREGMQSMLQPYDCETVAAATAPEALARLSQVSLQPDIIVADFRLQHDVTADSLIGSIRRHFDRAIPAIIVTGDTSADRLRQATEHGFPLLHKPVQPVELVRTIASMLKHPETA